VLKLVQDRPGLAWVGKLRPRSLDAEHRLARLEIPPGHRDLLKFVRQPNNVEALAKLLGQVSGQRWSVELPQPQESAPPTGSSQASEQRREAMNLSLVKLVGEIFDATVVAVQGPPTTQPPEDDADADDAYSDGARPTSPERPRDPSNPAS
jgi:hypothetical protein